MSRQSPKADTWIPIYIGDYLKDTGHLTTAQHGAYLLLLFQQWTSQTGYLPVNLESLRKIARMDPAEWADAWPVLQAFFKQCSEGCYSPRLAQVRADAEAKRVKYRNRAKNAADTRWSKRDQSLSESEDASSNASCIPYGNASGNAASNASADASSMLGQCPSPSEVDSPDGESRKRRKRAARLPNDWVLTDEWAVEGEIARLNAGLPSIDLRVEADKFRDYWHAKSGKDAAKADWLATWRNWCRNARSSGPPPSRPSATSPPDRKSRLSDTLRRRIADADRQDDTTP